MLSTTENDFIFSYSPLLWLFLSQRRSSCHHAHVLMLTKCKHAGPRVYPLRQYATLCLTLLHTTINFNFSFLCNLNWTIFLLTQISINSATQRSANQPIWWLMIQLHILHILLSSTWILFVNNATRKKLFKFLLIHDDVNICFKKVLP